MNEWRIKRFVNDEFQDTRYVIYEEGELGKPVAFMTELEFKRHIERCQEEWDKPKRKVKS